mmetsp:Transcript_109887/g.310922  ORF Transcript_109887/g.310922 Transcript_109887/m.310922 type:complete len:413 (+) Transcript_109887:84-1322(+)
MGRYPFVTLPLSLLVGASLSEAYEVPQPSMHRLTGADWHPVLAQAGFVQGASVFGVPLVSTVSVPATALTHAASVMAEYLDNDLDGQPDNPAVVEQLVTTRAVMVMFESSEDSEAFMATIGNDPALEAALFDQYQAQDLYAEETDHNGDLRFDASLEEVLHLITAAGYANAYPEAFGTSWSSTLGESIKSLYGDCEYSYQCNTGEVSRGAKRHSSGRFQERLRIALKKSSPAAAPRQAPSPCTHYADGNFIPGSCSGVYHYADMTCDEGCIVTEGIYWALTSLLGAQDKRCQELRGEWELGCRGEMEGSEVARPLVALLTDPAYRLATRIPTGTYEPRTTPSPAPALTCGGVRLAYREQGCCGHPTAFDPTPLACPSPAPLTCNDVKEAYRAQGCCKHRSQIFNQTSLCANR